MKYEQQETLTITRDGLVDNVVKLADEGWRLVQICSTIGDPMELTYSFDKDYKFVSLRLTVTRDDAVLPSITGQYLAAFTYENELQDLFGIKVTDLALDFKGTFYKTTIKVPFATKGPAVKPAAAAPSA